MPARSEKQRRFIFAKRRQWDKKSKTPKRWKWIWKPEWTKLAEGKIMSFDNYTALKFHENHLRYQ